MGCRIWCISICTGSTSLSESATNSACWPTDVYLERRLGICRSIAYQLLMLPLASIYDWQRIIYWLYHDIDSTHTADVHLLSRAPWPSTLCLIICVIRQSTLQRDHWKLTCSLLTSTLSALRGVNVLDKSTYLLTYLLCMVMLVGGVYCCPWQLRRTAWPRPW